MIRLTPHASHRIVPYSRSSNGTRYYDIHQSNLKEEEELLSESTSHKHL